MPGHLVTAHHKGMRRHCVRTGGGSCQHNKTKENIPPLLAKPQRHGVHQITHRVTYTTTLPISIFDSISSSLAAGPLQVIRNVLYSQTFPTFPHYEV